MSKITKGSLKRPTLLTMEIKKPIEVLQPTETVALAAEAVAAAAAPATQGGFDVTFSPGKHLVLSVFNGQTMIHIREYVRMFDREYPTKKGICLTPGRLKVLQGKIGEIDAVLNQQEVNASYGVSIDGGTLYKAHLGAGIYASIANNFTGVSLRRYWVPDGQLEVVPTKNGIFIPVSQWKWLKVK